MRTFPGICSFVLDGAGGAGGADAVVEDRRRGGEFSVCQGDGLGEVAVDEGQGDVILVILADLFHESAGTTLDVTQITF